jgi:F-type H+-transporting ATPase subunit gamma
MIRLLPIDKQFLKEIDEMDWPTNQIPTTHLPPHVLFSTLVQQLIFIRIYKAIAESLAAEHMTRMISMQNAEKNIDEHLEVMNLQYQQQRQQQITDELIDIVSGAEVLNQDLKKEKKEKKKLAASAAD